ncbi:MAG: sulfite exporter TauE/SafE family protein [Polyangiales bacterium]
MFAVSLPQLLAAASIGALGGFTRGISGFGAALVMVPLLSLCMPTQQAVVAVVVTNFLTGFPMAIGVRREADLRALLPIALAAMATMPLGMWLLVQLSSDHLRRLAALVVLAMVGLMMITRPMQLAWPWRLLAGGLSGVLNGAVSLGGPPVVLYFLARGAPAATSRASCVVYFALLQAAQMAALATTALITPSTLLWSAILTPCLLAGSYLGSVLFRAGGHVHFRAISLGLLACTGLAALVR